MFLFTNQGPSRAYTTPYKIWLKKKKKKNNIHEYIYKQAGKTYKQTCQVFRRRSKNLMVNTRSF